MLFDRRIRVVWKERYELLPRDGLPIVIEAVADDEKMPPILLCPWWWAGSLCNLISDETPVNSVARGPEFSCDAPLALTAVSVPADDFGVSGGIVCHGAVIVSPSGR